MEVLTLAIDLAIFIMDNNAMPHIDDCRVSCVSRLSRVFCLSSSYLPKMGLRCNHLIFKWGEEKHLGKTAFGLFGSAGRAGGHS